MEPMLSCVTKYRRDWWLAGALLGEELLERETWMMCSDTCLWYAEMARVGSTNRWVGGVRLLTLGGFC